MEAIGITKLCREVARPDAHLPPSTKTGGLQSGGRCLIRPRKIKPDGRGRPVFHSGGQPTATVAFDIRKARLAFAVAARLIEEGQTVRLTVMVTAMAMTGKKGRSPIEVFGGLRRPIQQSGGRATTKGPAQKTRLSPAPKRM